MNLFAYGTLMWPDVLADVIGRELKGRPVLLRNADRRRVKGEVYPTLVPLEGGEVTGVVYQGLLPQEIAALDRFEGVEYDRRTVTVEVDDGQVEAEAYFTSEAGLPLLENEAWTPDDLTMHRLMEFRLSYKGW